MRGCCELSPLTSDSSAGLVIYRTKAKHSEPDPDDCRPKAGAIERVFAGTIGIIFSLSAYLL